MFEFQSVRRSFPRNLAENSEAASFLDQTTSFETEVQEREPWDFYEWITYNEKPRCAPNIFPITFSLILYQSKNCGHRIHVLFMMYDVYWYCQMKKNEWLWQFWKRNDYENFEKRGGVVEKRGEEETKSMLHAPVWNTPCVKVFCTYSKD